MTRRLCKVIIPIILLLGILACFLFKGKIYITYLYLQDYIYLKYLTDIPKSADMAQFYLNSGYNSKEGYIAHGGGVGAYKLANSVEAVHNSLEAGLRFIELDFYETTDGHLVATHSMPELYKNAHYKTKDRQKISFEQVMEMKQKGAYNPVCEKEIRALMQEHPEIILVTDRITNYELLLREIPYPERMIVEVPSGLKYKQALDAGIKYPALTMRPNLTDLVKELNIPIVTAHFGAFCDRDKGIETLKSLHDNGITILLFNYRPNDYWDTPHFVKEYVGKYVSKIYTDIWAPSKLHELQHEQ